MKTEELAEYRKIAESLHLRGWELLRDTPDEVACRVCNGIGAEAFPAWLRFVISALHPSLMVVAVIHDIRYYYGDGSREDWRDANEDFRLNAATVAKHKYKWYSPRRQKVRLDGALMASACGGIVGWNAYLAAIAERKQDEHCHATEEAAE